MAALELAEQMLEQVKEAKQLLRLYRRRIQKMLHACRNLRRVLRRIKDERERDDGETGAGRYFVDQPNLEPDQGLQPRQ